MIEANDRGKNDRDKDDRKKGTEACCLFYSILRNERIISLSTLLASRSMVFKTQKIIVVPTFYKMGRNLVLGRKMGMNFGSFLPHKISKHKKSLES